MFIFLSLNRMWQHLLSRFIVALRRYMWIRFRSVSTKSSNIDLHIKKSIDLFYSYICVFGIWPSLTGSYTTLPKRILLSIFNILLINKWYIFRVFSSNQHLPSRRLIVLSVMELTCPHHRYEYSWLNSSVFIPASPPAPPSPSSRV